jgi:MFS family permease
MQDERTVMRLRLGVGAIGILLPLVLPLGNWIFAELRNQSTVGFWPTSMSGSYYTSTRNVFVGSLCALGVFLVGYRFDSRDDRCSTAAGLFAIGVALSPTAPGHNPTDYQTTIGRVHLGCASMLLFALAMFCISSFRDPKSKQKQFRDTKTSQRQWASHSYLVAGYLILFFLALAVVAGVTHAGDQWKITPLYICESFSVWAFGAAWVGAALELGAEIERLTRTRGFFRWLRWFGHEAGEVQAGMPSGPPSPPA